MIEGLAKYVGSKVLLAVLGVASILVIVWYWRLEPAERAGIWQVARGTLVWLAFVAALPWALFFVPARVVRAESNLVSGLVLLGYVVVDVLAALYLTGGSLGTRWQAAAMVVGFLCAAVYNFMVCEFLAERSENAI